MNLTHASPSVRLARCRPSPPSRSSAPARPGIAAAKALHERGVPFTCFEASDRVGGNWVFGNRNGMSAAYRQLYINTSRDRMEYSDFPMPKSYPDFPHHTQIAAYFDAYVEHFGFRDRIRFETKVAQAQRRADGGWELDARRRLGRALRCPARGQRPPLGPALARADVPGPRDASPARRSMPTPTVDNDLFADKDVVVLGMGNSAMDIAVEASYVAARTYLAARRGAWIIPKYMFGRPVDQLPQDPRVPFKVRQRMIHALIKLHVGDPERYGLPEPDHRFGEAHPTVSGRILDRIAARDDHAQAEHPPPRRRRGRVRRRLARARRRRRLLHGLQDQLPVLRRGPHLGPRQPHRAVPARLPPGVRRRVLRRPAAAAGGHMPLAEAQGQWIADYLKGEYALPPRPALLQDIADETAAMRKRYVASKRHTIQVDFDDYLHALGKERRGGRRARAPAGFRLPVRRRRADGTRRRPDAPPEDPSTATPPRPASASARRRPTARRSSSPRAACSATSATARRRCATSCARPTSPPAPSTTTSPTRSRCCGRWWTRSPSRRRARVRTARMGAHDARGLRRRRLSRLLRVPGRGSRHGRAHAPQRGDDPRRCSTSRPSGAGIDELRADLETAVAAGLIPPHDAELMAAAMVGAGVEVGLQMVEREPLDVERAVALRHQRLPRRVRTHGARSAPDASSRRAQLWACAEPVAGPLNRRRKRTPASMRRLLIPLAVLIALLAIPAGAQAPYTLGVSDQQAATFTNPLFAPLKFKAARYITPYDVMDEPGRQGRSCDAWIGAARAAHQKILVSFEHSHAAARAREGASVGRRVHEGAQEVQAGLSRRSRRSRPGTRSTAATHARRRVQGQPTSLQQGAQARRAVLHGRAQGLHGLEVHDRRRSTSSTSRTSTRRSATCSRSCATRSRTRRSSASTTTRTRTASRPPARSACWRALSGKVWLTETGGIVKLGRSFPSSTTRAAKALGCMFTLAKSNPRIQRLYVYQFNPAADRRRALRRRPDQPRQLQAPGLRRRQEPRKARPLPQVARALDV